MTKARILADYVAGGTTAAEFDYMDGVTSNVQTQLDAKAPLASPTFTGNFTSVGIDDNADATAITIDSNERVGINVASPTSQLHVQNSSDTAQNAIQLNNDNGRTSFHISQNPAGSANMELKSDDGSNVAVKVHIDSDGDSYFKGGEFTFGDQAQPAGSRVNIFESTLGNRCLMLSKGDSDTSSSNWFVGFRTNGNVSNGSIRGNGASNAAFASWSDERLKENIATATGQLDLINQLRPVTFKWKANDETAIGFIAQEFQKILPENVGDEPPTEEQTKAGETGTLSVIGWASSDARLVGAIQELSAKNDALETENTALKTRMDALEARVTALESA